MNRKMNSWIKDRLQKAEDSGLFSGLFTGNPQGPGFVMNDYTREQTLGSVGIGWGKLVGALWDFCKMQNPPIDIHQVKEKFGTLRFYVGGVTSERYDSVYTIISAVEHLSGYICEVCGEEGKLRGQRWYYTSCNKHAKIGDKDSEDEEQGE